MNNLNIVFINENYLNFIRRLPCCVTGKKAHAHHVSVTGMGGNVRNDYYAVPLNQEIHTGKGHISEKRLQSLICVPLQELIVFYICLYIEYECGRYDIDADESCHFFELRRKLKGI